MTRICYSNRTVAATGAARFLRVTPAYGRGAAVRDAVARALRVSSVVALRCVFACAADSAPVFRFTSGNVTVIGIAVDTETVSGRDRVLFASRDDGLST